MFNLDPSIIIMNLFRDFEHIESVLCRFLPIRTSTINIYYCEFLAILDCVHGVNVSKPGLFNFLSVAIVWRIQDCRLVKKCRILAHTKIFRRRIGVDYLTWGGVQSSSLRSKCEANLILS